MKNFDKKKDNEKDKELLLSSFLFITSTFLMKLESKF